MCAETRLPGVPNYSQDSSDDEPWQRRSSNHPQHKAKQEGGGAQNQAQQRKWWDYQAPTAAVGRPDISLKAVGIPQVSPGAG